MKNFAYTASILGAVIIAYNFPQYFTHIGDFELKVLIVPLLQVIMFGMGTTITFEDFKGIIKTPRAVGIGLVCQFAIMPFWGFGITQLFDFPAEIAAGVILIGASPSGLASNVMSLIAKANIALSITITTFATLLAPLITPTLMQWLGGEFIKIDILAMTWSMMKIVLIPVVLGFLLNAYAAKLIKGIKKYLPLVSMIGIAFIIVVITAAGSASLKTVGGLLLVAVILHNVGGYLFGYGAARLFGMNEQDCRTISLEVGMQNGGLASGLAIEMGKAATVGLAPALFGPLMNVTGSMLASFWGGKPAEKPKE